MILSFCRSPVRHVGNGADVADGPVQLAEAQEDAGHLNHVLRVLPPWTDDVFSRKLNQFQSSVQPFCAVNAALDDFQTACRFAIQIRNGFTGHNKQI